MTTTPAATLRSRHTVETLAVHLAGLLGRDVTVTDHDGGTRTGRLRALRPEHVRVGRRWRIRTVHAQLDVLGQPVLFDLDRVIDLVAAQPAALPDCSTFVGAGQRCTSCRVRRPLHA